MGLNNACTVLKVQAFYLARHSNRVWIKRLHCIGIFYERKDALLLYLEEQQKVQTNELLEKLIESFRTTVELYRRVMFEILGGGTEGWNSLFEPVDKTCYPEIANVLEELKASEERNVELAKCVADGI